MNSLTYYNSLNIKISLCSSYIRLPVVNLLKYKYHPMFFLYLRLALQNMIRTPLFTLVNILGVSIAMVCVLLIGLWINDEFRYDDHLTRGDRLYRLTVEVSDPAINLHSHFARSYQAWPWQMKDHFPEIEELVRLSRIFDMVIKDGEKQFLGKFHYADSSFLRIFDIPLLAGDPKTALAEPNSVVLSKSYASTHFPKTDILGKEIQVYCRNCPEKVAYRVTGIMEDLPETSHFSMDLLASFPEPEKQADWAYYYLLLKPGSQADSLLKKIPAFIRDVAGEEEARISIPHLQGVKDIHLYSHKDRELSENGNIRMVRLFGGIAIFVLFIALINFLNLRMAALLAGQKSFLVMKTFGAHTGSFFIRGILESGLLAVLSLLIALTTLTGLIGPFNSFANKAISFTEPGNPILFLSAALIILTLLTGILPYLRVFILGKKTALVSLRPQQAELPFLKKGARLSVPRLLIALQFAAATLLIVAAIAVKRQAQYLMGERLGEKNEKIVCLQNLPVQVTDRYTFLRESLLGSPLIRDVTATMEDPGDEALDKMPFEADGVAPELGKKLMYVYPAGDNLFRFYGIPLVAGTDFPAYTGNDSLPESYILNESAVQMLGLSPEEAIGKPFNLVPGWDGGTLFHHGRIVGVVKDFYTGSLRFPLAPTCYFQKKFWMFSCQVKVDPARTEEAMKHIQACWSKAYPEFPISYIFIEDLYGKVYAQELRQQQLLIMFALLAILISGLGLWSVSSLVTRQRTREIGIRKVNGAGTLDIILQLNREFMVLVGIALLIAIPAGYFLLQHWMQQYANQALPGAGLYILAILIAGGTAILTVTLQCWKTAAGNPVNSLRYE
jgi:putative ABC transport system permease protein